MEKENKIFVAIVLGSFIIGSFVFLFLEYTSVPVKNESSLPSKNDSSYNSIPQAPALKSDSICNADEHTLVTKVIDGDTVVVKGGYHVRLLGIDADEKGYPCYQSAKTRLEELILNKKVTLEKDTTDVDQYKRCLRTIFLAKQNIDVTLVKEGLAVARFYEPDVKYKNEISLAEKQAMENSTGCKWNNIQ